MGGSLIPDLFRRAIDSNGNAIPGALASFYLTGTLTRTPTYATAALSVANPNPVQSDSGGLFPEIFLDPSVTYRRILTRADGTSLGLDDDPISGYGQTGGATQYATVATASGVNIPSATLLIQTLGFASAGDGGGAFYQKTSVAAPGPGKFQSADGQWWILAGSGPFSPAQFGAKGDAVFSSGWSGTDNTTALQNWLNFSNNLCIGPGAYLTDPLSVGGAISPVGITIIGAGSLQSELVSNATSGAVLNISSGTKFNNIILRGFGIKGPGLAGNTLSGIALPAGLVQAYSIEYDDLWFDLLGGNGIQDAVNSDGAGAFAALYKSVAGNCGGSLFDVHPGPSCTFLNCYPHNVNIGFRVRSSAPVFIGCDGIDSGSYVVVCGDSTGDGDPDDAQCRPTFIGCNFEAATIAGVWSKNNGVVWINSVCGAASANAKGIMFSAGLTPDLGSIDDPINSFYLDSGGSWANGFPIHINNAFPWFYVGGNAPVSMYDDTNLGTVMAQPGSGQQLIASGYFGPGIAYQSVFNGYVASTTHTLAGATPITRQVGVVSTVANSGDAVSLLPSFPGLIQTIFNSGTNPMAIFPGLVGDSIDGHSAGTSITLTNGKRALFICVGPSQWTSAQLGVPSA